MSEATSAGPVDHDRIVQHSVRGQLSKSGLEAFDIDASLADADTIGVNWLWSNALGGVKVQVPESEVEEARRVLAAEPGDEPDAPEATVCPCCGSADTHYFLDKRASFLTWLVLGIPVVPAFSRRACAGCGFRWKAWNGTQFFEEGFFSPADFSVISR
jgi:hypothetical protein